MRQISILGCGWLGFPLAKSLIVNGFSVKGSTTSLEKISLLTEADIIPYIINLSSSQINGEIDAFLENSEILIIDIPPKLRGNSNGNFVDKIHVLIPYIEKSTIKKVIFTSSISVYQDKNSIITEETIPKPETESGSQLWEVEKILQSNINFKTTIVRFGGLIGSDRHPIFFLAGRKNLENPNAPINLIHQKDCIGILQQIIEINCFGEIFNAVTPFHPSRKTYYTQKAIELNLSFPEFYKSLLAIGKTVESTKLETILGYQFQNKNL